MANETEDVGLLDIDLTDAERRVLDRLKRALHIARMVDRNLDPTLEDLLELDERIQDEGWETLDEE